MPRNARASLSHKGRGKRVRGTGALPSRPATKYHAQNNAREDVAMAQSHVFAAVGGYYGAKDKGGMAGVFRHRVGDVGWSYALKELETFTVFVNPRDTSQVFAGTTDGVYRSTDS